MTSFDSEWEFNCSSLLNASDIVFCDEAICDFFGCTVFDYQNMPDAGISNATVLLDGRGVEDDGGQLNSPQPLISDDFRIAYRSFFTYFATAWCAFSILSNTATIIVLNHKTMKSTTNFLLTAVACSNVVIGSLYLPFTVYFYIILGGKMDSLSLPVATALWLFVPTMLCAHMTQMWLTVAVTLFRLLFVKYAHRSQELCSTRRARFALVGVTVGCMLLSIPCLLGHKVMLCTDAYPPDTDPGVCESGSASGNATASHSGSSHFYTLHLEKETDGNFAVFRSMLLWINSVIGKFLPAVLLCGLSAMLVSTMKDADKRRHHLRARNERRDTAARKSIGELTDERDKKTNRTTRLLVVIAIMFIITYLPQSTLELIGSFYEVVWVEIGDKLGDVNDTLSLLNSGMTFFLYCFMSQQFRTVFSQVFIYPIARLCRCGLKEPLDGLASRRASAAPASKCQLTTSPSVKGKRTASIGLKPHEQHRLSTDLLSKQNNVHDNVNKRY